MMWKVKINILEILFVVVKTSPRDPAIKDPQSVSLDAVAPRASNIKEVAMDIFMTMDLCSTNNTREHRKVSQILAELWMRCGAVGVDYYLQFRIIKPTAVFACEVFKSFSGRLQRTTSSQDVEQIFFDVKIFAKWCLTMCSSLSVVLVS